MKNLSFEGNNISEKEMAILEWLLSSQLQTWQWSYSWFVNNSFRTLNIVALRNIFFLNLDWLLWLAHKDLFITQETILHLEINFLSISSNLPCCPFASLSHCLNTVGPFSYICCPQLPAEEATPHVSP